MICLKATTRSTALGKLRTHHLVLSSFIGRPMFMIMMGRIKVNYNFESLVSVITIKEKRKNQGRYIRKITENARKGSDETRSKIQPTQPNKAKPKQ